MNTELDLRPKFLVPLKIEKSKSNRSHCSQCGKRILDKERIKFTMVSITKFYHIKCISDLTEAKMIHYKKGTN